ncbi:hypothetical protein EELLY_v1c02600 [Entomoplasma ellychniae]|uniref:Transmembrane protein n=1 Tax=Entomoplasma ellychniae TaxID=2114 RepID=A0A8E2QXU4_9MOLU|nr:hypothetical protein [Entomoplasma ellychniae]PPE04580.1 hypothetical protein EELLY_v1c02600 [Entomoplasma ellychniae]
MDKRQVYLKYLLTVATLALLISISTIFIYLRKQPTSIVPSWLTSVVVLFWVIGFSLLFIYWFVKLKDIFISKEFKFSNKDKRFAMYSLSCYVAEAIVAIIFIILAHYTKILIWEYILHIVIIIVLSMIGSILELYSRIQYQVYLNQKAYTSYEENKQKIVKNLLKEHELDKNQAEVLASNQNRTKQAQEILQQDITNRNKINPFDEEI